MIRILVVDDQRVVREGLAALLRHELDFLVVGIAENGQEAIELVQTLGPDVVLMDLQMPVMDGLTATQIISQRYSQTKIIALTSVDDDMTITQLLSAGAGGYLLKRENYLHEDEAAIALVEAVRSVHKGYVQLGPGVMQKIIASQTGFKSETPPLILTEQESKAAASSPASFNYEAEAQPERSEVMPSSDLVIAGENSSSPSALATSSQGELAEKRPREAEAFSLYDYQEQPTFWQAAIARVKSHPIPSALVGLALVAIAGGGMAKYVSGQANPTVATSNKPAPGLIKGESASVAALGKIEPKGELISISGTKGERLGRLLVREGQQVKAGQPLAYLDSHQEKVAQRDLSQTQLAEARGKLASEIAYGQSQVQEARSRIEQVSSPKTSEIAAQKATIGRIKGELNSALRDLQRFTQLQREGAVSQQVLDNQSLAVQTKREELKNAEATLGQLLREATADTANAKAQLQSAQAGLARSQAQVQVASAISNLRLATAQLESTIIRAPSSGQVIKILTRQGEVIGDKGILEMGNTSQMYVVAEVYETDIPRIKVGQPAKITSPVLSKAIYGIVEQVGLTINQNDVVSSDPAANTDNRVVQVKIRLGDSRSVATFTNLQVNVAITPIPKSAAKSSLQPRAQTGA
jgi:HlyD family secretion protein